MKKGVESIGFIEHDIKRTKAFRFFRFSVWLILGLILVWCVFLSLWKLPQGKYEKGLEGEMRTLKWDVNSEYIKLDVLFYNLTNENQTIEINVNWSSGKYILKNISFDFVRRGKNCNSTTTDLMEYKKNKTYEIHTEDTNCGPEYFTGVTSVRSFANVHINLTQIALIPNITRYNNDNLTNIMDLDDYFSCLVGIRFSVVGDPEERTGIKIHGNTNKISFDPKLNRYGTYRFNLTALSEDGDVLNVSNSGVNMSFFVIFINSNRPVPNNAPDFLRSKCGSFSIDVNKTRTLKINMEECFEDDDGDVLAFRFDNSSMKNISVSRSSTNLTLTSNSGFIGREEFYIYANDSIDETGSGKIDVVVFNSSAITSRSVNPPRVLSSSPRESRVFLSSNESRLFSLVAQNYETITWYLDSVLVQANSTNYNVLKLSGGNHIVKAEIKRGSHVESKTWNLLVENIEDEIPEEPSINWSRAFFYILIILLGVIILVVAFFIIKGVVFKRKESPMVSQSSGHAGVLMSQGAPPRDFGAVPFSNQKTF